MVKRRRKVLRSKRAPSLSDRVRTIEQTMRTARDAQLFGSYPPLSSERPLLAQLLKDAEMRAATIERDYKALQEKLVRLLSKDQLEAAKIAGCTPELYAIEWIEISKDKLFPQFDATLRPFSKLS